MPEESVLLLILALDIGDGGLAVRAPVYHSYAVINKTLVVEIHEHFLNGSGAALVKGKALALPVAGASQLLELLNDTSAVNALPVPCALEEFLSAYLLLCEPFLFHLADYFRLGRD